MANNLPVEVNSDIYYCCDLRSFHDKYLCSYAHVRDVEELKNIDVRRIVCSFNLAKKCKYKDNCMFAHLISSESNDANDIAVQEETSSHLGMSVEPVPARELSSRNVNPHLTQEPDNLELVNNNAAVSEQFEQVLRFDENQLTEKENEYANIREPKSIPNELCNLAKEHLENSGEDLINHLPHERLIENRNSTNLESMSPNTGLTSEGTSISNSAAAIVAPIPSAESARENETDVFPQNQLEKEIDTQSGDCLELIATDQTSVSQKSAFDAEASTSQPSNNGNELEPVSTVPGTCCSICLSAIGSFGILSNCEHPFCWNCIKTWRDQAKPCIIMEVSPYEELWHDRETYHTFEAAQEAIINGVDPKTARSCPICRKLSNFVIPSHRWIEGDSAKDEFITSYKARLSKINCKYYSRNGECRFGKACFYLHAAFYCKALRAKYTF